jgi:adenylosuccinate synthase
MAVTVVVGGQFGSEGKGKLVSHLACKSEGPTAVVRSGGSNAGHTADGFGRRFMLRQLPSGAVAPDCELFLAAGMQIDLDVLLDEIQRVDVGPSRLRIDPNAVVISDVDRASERRADLNRRLGSTLSGTGFALARKVRRDPALRRAQDVPELDRYLLKVADALNSRVDEGAQVIVEGTQGFGLSLHHGTYPFVTSRDTTASAFLSECGLAPSLATEVLVVMRTYPIRVAGNSGPLRNELSWDQVARKAGYPTALAEYTTVTGQLRRVAEFDWELATRAVAVNRPSAIALHGIDYVNHDDLGAADWEGLSPTSRRFVARLEKRVGCYVRYIFTGPDGSDLIDRGPQAHWRGAERPERRISRGRS